MCRRRWMFPREVKMVFEQVFQGVQSALSHPDDSIPRYVITLQTYLYFAMTLIPW